VGTMIKAHKIKWGYWDPKKVWHGHEIIIYYYPGGENPWDRFIINVPEEIASATGRKTVTAETAEGVRKKLNSVKEDYIAILAPKTKTKIIKYDITIKSGNSYYGDHNVVISLQYYVWWVVKQEGREYKIEEELNGELKLVNGYFNPETDKHWMAWTQEREKWFEQFQKNVIELAHKFEKFYEETFPKDSEDLGKAIDSGNLLPPFKNTSNLLTSGKE
jgi:hypothetical protein